MKSIVLELLKPDPMSRLGAGEPDSGRGYPGLKSHKFFEGIDWENHHKAEAPFKPAVADINDTSFFSQDKKFDMSDLADIQ